MCRRFRADRGPEAYVDYELAKLAPMVSMSLRDQRSLKLDSQVRGYPTFVVVDKQSREIGRVVGYNGNMRDFLRQMSGLVAQLERARRFRGEAGAD